MTELKLADGTITWMKQKYTMRKTKGRYQGGPKPATVRKRSKKGAKTYTPGQWVMFVSSTGKTRMVKMW